jgi:tripartite motif-containing protein 56
MATCNDSNTKQLQELVTCAICLDHYQDPRLLPCSHTFCLNCIRQLVKSGQFDCPLRDNTIINQNDINTLPINRTAKDMVEFLLSLDVSTGRKISQLCDNCNENQAVHWCDK